MVEKLCRNCKHWTPLFPGDHWGVRSFIDAPEAEQAAIKARLAAAAAEHRKDPVDEAPNDGYSGPIRWRMRSGADDVPGGPDWPEWGECVLTDVLNCEQAKHSLARAIDGSQYLAILRCHANFGCIQYEEYKTDGP